MNALSVHKQYSLRQHNTLGFDQLAEHFVVASNDQQIEQAVALAHSNKWPLRVIGEGSNIVLTQDIPGLALHLGDDTIHYDAAGTAQQTLVSVGAGANWDHLVHDTLLHGLNGLENLSLIPGTAGAAPVQNIGAYGVEVKELIESVRAFHIGSQQWHEFSKDDGDYSYRHSMFKKNAGQYIISKVTLSLGQQHALKYAYKDLHSYLEECHQMPPTPQQIRDAVISIRQSKLPDPDLIGNAGSFFHNPIVSTQKSAALKQAHPKLPVYPVDTQLAKISAGWMIDSLGFKGVKQHGVGVYEKQALVLVHFGDASGERIIELANQIIDRVQERFGVQLHIEPLVI